MTSRFRGSTVAGAWVARAHCGTGCATAPYEAGLRSRRRPEASGGHEASARRTTTAVLVAPPGRDGVLPHDQRVLAVVGVVAAPDAPRLEAEPLVQRDRGRIRDAHLEGVAAARVVDGQGEQAL